MLYPDESYRIMGACFEVHNRMGAGFLESVYQECLTLEFALQGISFVAQPELRLTYRDQTLIQTFRPDFVCFDCILIESKAVDRLIDKHESQVLNYLHATRLELGLLINFGAAPKLDCKRFALSQRRPANNAKTRE